MSFFLNLAFPDAGGDTAAKEAVFLAASFASAILGLLIHIAEFYKHQR